MSSYDLASPGGEKPKPESVRHGREVKKRIDAERMNQILMALSDEWQTCADLHSKTGLNHSVISGYLYNRLLPFRADIEMRVKDDGGYTGGRPSFRFHPKLANVERSQSDPQR